MVAEGQTVIYKLAKKLAYMRNIKDLPVLVREIIENEKEESD